MTEMPAISNEPDTPSSEPDASSKSPKRPRRRWWRLQYGLRWLLLLGVITALVAAWMGRRQWREEPMLDGMLTLRVQVKKPGWFFMKDRGEPYRHGKAELRDAEGRILARGHYYNDVPAGKWTYYDLQGRKRQEGKIIEQEIPIGPWTTWSPDTGEERRRVFEIRETDIRTFNSSDGSPYYFGAPDALVYSAEPGESLIVSNGRYAYLWVRDDTLPPPPPLDGKELAELQRRLCDPAEERWDRSLQTLASQGAAAVPALTAGLQCSDPVRRRACIRVLESLGTEAMPAAELLAGLADDEDAETALTASAALMTIDADRREASLTRLIDSLQTGTPPIQNAARRALVQRFDLLWGPLEKLAKNENTDRRMQLLDLIEAYLADPVFEKVFFERRKEQCDRIFGMLEQLGADKDRFVAGRARYLIKQRPLIEAPPAEDYRYMGGMAGGGGFM